MKRFISVLLSLLIVMGCTQLCYAADSRKTYPVITLVGRDSKLEYVDADGQKVYPNEINKTEIENAVKQCLPLLGKALISGDYQPWIDAVMEVYTPYFEDILPDKNGDITNGTHRSSFEGIAKLYGGGNNYTFQYDWRVDPCALADELNNMIQQIKSETGKEKVNLFARCYGSNLLAAYLGIYGHDDVDTVVFSASSAMGAETASCAFSGKISVDAASLEDYLDSKDSITGDTVTDELIISTVEYLNTFYGLTVPTETINLTVKQLYYIIAPYLLRASYGAFASVWSMVSQDDYDEALEIVFSGYEDEYKGLIEKIDRYHKIQGKLPELLKQYHNEGMRIAVFARYNSAMMPIFDTSTRLNDDTVLVNRASFGAVCADNNKTLSRRQLANADEAYVSPDKMIDASACILPDNTWFIKDLGHGRYTQEIYDFLSVIFNSDEEVTIKSEGAFPQYTRYDEETGKIAALEAENDERPWIVDYFSEIIERFTAFIRSLVEFISEKLINTDTEQEYTP